MLLTELLGVAHPILQAPMAGAMDFNLAAAVSSAGGLGAIPCAMLDATTVRAQVAAYRAVVPAPVHLNFFCHTPAAPDLEREQAWRARLAPYYAELGVQGSELGSTRIPFDRAMLDLVLELRVEIVSFHFGMPAAPLVEPLRKAGCKILATATTVGEARAVTERGADVVIAQGLEAGGHRGMFLGSDPDAQVGTFALVPQIVDAVRNPVVAAGGIADGRGVAAALALGAAGAMLGTAYLRCPEARISAPYRAALAAATDDATRVTNVFTGKPARGIINRAIRELGPLSPLVPGFPRAATALAPLRQAAEQRGSGDFSPMWAGQAVPLARTMPAAELTRLIVDETRAVLARLSPR